MRSHDGDRRRRSHPGVSAGGGVLGACTPPSLGRHRPRPSCGSPTSFQVSPTADLSGAGSYCPCTQDGLSNGVNTSHVGCGQWLAATGSNSFVCYVQQSSACSSHATQSSTLYHGAALRSCSPSTAQLPALAELLAATPQALLFLQALQIADLPSLPGTQLTVFAPTNDALITFVDPVQLLNATAMRELVLQSVLSGALATDQLAQAGSVHMVSGDTYAITALAGAQSWSWRGGGEPREADEFRTCLLRQGVWPGS